MRVLHVIDSLEPAGAEHSLLAMARYLVDQGVELEIAHFGAREGLGPRFVQLGIPVQRCGVAGFGSRVRWVHDLALRSRPSLVHTTLFQADQTGRLGTRWAGVPVVSSLVNLAYGADQREAAGLPRWKLGGARLVDMSTARLVRRFHAISLTVATVMGRRLRIPRSRIDVVPRGRDPAALGRRSTERRDATRAALGIESSTPMILTAARHEAQKGLESALAAMEIVRRSSPDAVLCIAGREGTATERLRIEIAASGLEKTVRLLGPRSDVPDLMAAADVFLFPSRWEGLGGVLIEAMALEVPIVCTDLPVARELLVDDDGRLLARFAAVGDAPGLAGGCLGALTDPGDAPVHGRERFLRYYTAEQAARGLVHFYERSLS